MNTRISLPVVGFLLVFQTGIATYDAIVQLRPGKGITREEKKELNRWRGIP